LEEKIEEIKTLLADARQYVNPLLPPHVYVQDLEILLPGQHIDDKIDARQKEIN
jgi:hypothetical protein